MESLMEHAEKVIEQVKVDICEDYCRYPREWDEEQNGELYDSDICNNCPLNRL